MITYREQWFDGLPVSQAAAEEFVPHHGALARKYIAANDNTALADPADANQATWAGLEPELAAETFAPLEKLPSAQEWLGGPMPVEPAAYVEIVLRCGLHNEGRADAFDWRHGASAFGYEGDDDIVSYRVIDPPADTKDPPRAGDFIQTYTGRKFWPMDPRADEVFIEDIAHALALQCRYAGHCLRFYSVAEHSVLMARHLLTTHGRTAAIYALLHDASEAYLVDVPRPVKPHLLGYAEAEGRVSNAVFARFRLTPALPQSVKDADNAILANEIENMMPMDWQKRLPPKLDTNMHYWTPERAEVEFLATFEALMCGRAAA